MLQYAVTDRRRLASGEAERQAALCRLAEKWGRAGVDFVQLREPDMRSGALAELARKVLKALAWGSGEKDSPKLIINSSPDVAIAVGAHGVHLTSAPGSLTVGQVRHLYTAAGLGEPVVSLSAHSPVEAELAREAGANLVLFGPVFEKVVGDPTAPHEREAVVLRGVGLDLLRSSCLAANPIPVLALGGITEANVDCCLKAGAAGIAAIRFFAF